MMCDVRPSPNAIGSVTLALAVLAVVGKVDGPGRRVVQRDVQDVRTERFGHLVAHQRHQETEVELGRGCLTDIVDDGQLSSSLTRLGDEPCVVERHAQARGESRQQADVGLAERVSAVEILERDAAE